MSDYIIYLLFLFVFTIIYGLLCFAITNQQQKNYGFGYRLEPYQVVHQQKDAIHH